MGSLGLASDSVYENSHLEFNSYPILDSTETFEENYENFEYPQNDLFKNDDYLPKDRIFKKKNQVFLEGYVENNELGRSKSLTDEDLEELKGCLDLGFGFSYEEIPELCNTLPALELCYSMSQKFLDEQHKLPESSHSPVALPESPSPPSGSIANWRISSPGDHPEDVKARLKFWAQAVACTVKLCN